MLTSYHRRAVTTTATLLLFFIIGVRAPPYHSGFQLALPRDGPAVNILGYGQTTYQAIRYEPLCGTLDESFKAPISVGRCTAVMDVYSNNTVDTLALYDETGVRLSGAIVGGGVDLCMCFALSTSSGARSDICWWMSGGGQQDIWWTFQNDYIVAGTFRPGAAKALPQCGSLDLLAAKASWSATAVRPTLVEATRQVGTGTASGAGTATGSVSPTGTSRPSSGSSKTVQNIGTGVGIFLTIVIILGVVRCLRKKDKYVPAPYVPPRPAPQPIPTPQPVAPRPSRPIARPASGLDLPEKAPG